MLLRSLRGLDESEAWFRGSRRYANASRVSWPYDVKHLTGSFGVVLGPELMRYQVRRVLKCGTSGTLVSDPPLHRYRAFRAT